MSNQSNSSIYNEKKIAAYESWFKESSFAKPMEVYLTITVAHVFGQAYITEQQGTTESDPVYQRFVCPLEDITKVYINDNVKASPLLIQCDTDVKGVVHRKRIIVPCLENVASIVEQLNEVRALHMEKYEAAQQRQKDKKREALEAARRKEQLEREAKSAIPPLPEVEKFDIEAASEAMKAEPAPAAAKPIEKPAPVVEAAKPAPAAEIKKDEPIKPDPKPASAIKPHVAKSVSELNSEVEESLKALDMFASQMNAKTSSAAPKKPALDLNSIPDAAPVVEAVKPVEKPAPAVEAVKPVEKPAPAVEAVKPIEKSAPAVEAVKPVEKPAPVAEAVKPVEKPAPVAEAVKPVEKPAPVAEAVKPAPKPAPRVNPNGKAMELADYQAAVMKLKTMKDSGELSEDAYNEEKKKLLAQLY